MRRLAFLLTLTLGAEIVDRIAVSVGNQAITETQIAEEIRLTAFLNRAEPDFSPAERRKAAERLVEQTLFRRDIGFGHFPLPDITQAVKMEEPILAQYQNDDARLREELRRRGLTEDQLRRHLLWQITLLRFIEYRFRPSVQVPEPEIRQYYQKKRGEWQQQGAANIPSLDESRAGIEKILTQQRVDQAVDRWLGDARTQLDILYRKEAFE